VIKDISLRLDSVLDHVLYDLRGLLGRHDKVCSILKVVRGLECQGFVFDNSVRVHVDNLVLCLYRLVIRVLRRDLLLGCGDASEPRWNGRARFDKVDNVCDRIHANCERGDTGQLHSELNSTVLLTIVPQAEVALTTYSVSAVTSAAVVDFLFSLK